MSDRFHIDRSVSVGHIVTTLALIGSLVVFALRTETKIEINAARIEATEKRIDRETLRTASEIEAIRASQIRMEDKIDRIIERQAQ